MLKLFGRVLFLGLVAAAVYALWRRLTESGDTSATTRSFMPTAVPAPTASPVGVRNELATTPAPDAVPVTPSSWVEPDDGACPGSHPVKAKLSSGIFHLPGGQNYERTRADRCYTDARSAEADDLRQAKR